MHDPRPIQIPVEHARVEHVSGLHQQPEGGRARAAILLAHGAGAGMKSAFLERTADGLAARGFAVLRFNYPYAERMQLEGKRFPPDRFAQLEATHERALARLLELQPQARALAAGKSMGGRVASVIAAKGAAVQALAFFGYPLHPAGKPERLRSEHFAAIAQPALFLQGTRDALCDLELLRRELRRFGGPVRLERIEGGDHDFKLPRAAGRSHAEVIDGLVAAFDTWAREDLGL